MNQTFCDQCSFVFLVIVGESGDQSFGAWFFYNVYDDVYEEICDVMEVEMKWIMVGCLVK